jgi:hypothetical protein
MALQQPELVDINFMLLVLEKLAKLKGTNFQVD